MNRVLARDALEIRRATRDEFSDVTTSLIAEFAGQVPAGTVIRCLALSRENLLRSGVRAGLAAAAESSARMRLSGMRPAHGSGN
jgi:hypothetical protein